MVTCGFVSFSGKYSHSVIWLRVWLRVGLRVVTCRNVAIMLSRHLFPKQLVLQSIYNRVECPFDPFL